MTKSVSVDIIAIGFLIAATLIGFGILTITPRDFEAIVLVGFALVLAR